MKEIIYSLIENFVLGGSIVVIISYICTFFNPLIGAILWSFPISLLPTLFFMKKHGKKSKHMANFTRSTTYALILLVISTGFLSIFIREDKKESLWLPISKTFGVWLIASMIFFAVIKYFKLEDKFI
jgi:hypothetical protein